MTSQLPSLYLVTWSMNGPEVSGIAYNHSLPSNFKVSHHKGRYGVGRASEKKKTSALCTLSMLEVLSLISQNRGCTNGTITLLILAHSANWSDIGGHWKNIWHLRPNILQTGLKKVEPSGTKVPNFTFSFFLFWGCDFPFPLVPVVAFISLYFDTLFHTLICDIKKCLKFNIYKFIFRLSFSAEDVFAGGDGDKWVHFQKCSGGNPGWYCLQPFRFFSK